MVAVSLALAGQLGRIFLTVQESAVVLRWVGSLRFIQMSSKIRLLFLDFDGVLHRHDAHFALAEIKVPIEQLLAAHLFIHCRLLYKIIEPYPDVGLVVNSTWRKTHSIQELRELVGPLGQRLVAVTAPELDREASILDFMRRRHLAIDQVVILDDQANAFAELRSRVIASDPVEGIAVSGIQQALAAILAA